MSERAPAQPPLGALGGRRDGGHTATVVRQRRAQVLSVVQPAEREVSVLALEPPENRLTRGVQSNEFGRSCGAVATTHNGGLAVASSSSRAGAGREAVATQSGEQALAQALEAIWWNRFGPAGGRAGP